MGSTLDALNVPQSLTQRRQANLPNFELPPPSALQFAPMQQQKYPPPPQHLSNNSALSLGNLLTPPSNSASDSSGASSAIFNGNTPNSAAGPVLPYTPTLFNSGNTPTLSHWLHSSAVATRLESSVSTEVNVLASVRTRTSDAQQHELSYHGRGNVAPSSAL